MTQNGKERRPVEMREGEERWEEGEQRVEERVEGRPTPCWELLEESQVFD